MEKYDYLQSVTEDVMEWLDENLEYLVPMNREEFEEYLNEHLWAEDSVTGNGSGSYWFSSYKAEEALCHNLDLLQEAMSEWGDTDAQGNKLLESPESADVTIRCYLLGQAISEALDRYEEDGKIKYAEDAE